jgi:hypothetical protein
MGGYWLEAQSCLRMLIRGWLQREQMPSHPGKPRLLMPMEFVAARMRRLSARLIAGNAGPLLACPTHRGGWVEPREFVRRLRVWQECEASENQPIGVVNDRMMPDVLDLIQGLLRLAPDHRDAALADAKDLLGPVGAAVRFALGGDESVGRPAGLWIAAARARDPWGAFGSLTEAFGNLGPDGAIPARRSWTIQENGSWRNRLQLDIQVTPTAPPEHEWLTDRPLQMLNRHPEVFFAMTSVASIRCRLAIWPANPDASFADGAMQIIERMHAGASTFSPTAPYLEPLFDPDTSFSEAAQLALAVGLLSKEPGTRGLAIDALIALVEDGRCIGDELGGLLANLSLKKGAVHLNRLAESLADAARASRLHRHVASQIIQGTIAALLPPAPADLHHLLTLLHEWLIQSGEPLASSCRLLLESISGTGKTASLASALLKMEHSAERKDRCAIFAEALRGRVARAKRWSKASCEVAKATGL